MGPFSTSASSYQFRRKPGRPSRTDRLRPTRARDPHTRSLPPSCAALLVVLLLASATARPARSEVRPVSATHPRTARSASGSSRIDREIDPALARIIWSTRAIDNHAHPKLSPPDDVADRGFDALPVDNMEPQTDPVAWRPDLPALTDAWRALYGFRPKPGPHNTGPLLPLSPAEAARLEAARDAVKAREGEHYDAWVLDQANISTVLANRVAPGRGVAPPRFLWVPYADALLFPLDNTALGATSPDRAQFFALEDKLRTRYLADSGLHALPPTLDNYLQQVVFATLARQKSAGAVAEKFEVAYLRSLDFGDPPPAQAGAVYARYVAGGVPDNASYKLLQDFLFRQIALECGRLGLPIQLHGMAGGGRYFSVAGVNPMLLEPLLNDPRLKATSFVLLHGGWPYVREAGALLQKPNFFLDLSQEAILFPARTLSLWLREWLETYPDKVLFGTDGYPYSASMGWEESTWLANRNARRALGLALTGMEHDGEISPARAAQIARMVLQSNAAHLYAFPHEVTAAAPTLKP